MIREVFEILREEPDAPSTIRCSVVVPTYRRLGLLERALDALVNQTLAPHEYEIIVCDDAQCDATRDFIEQWRTQHAVAVTYCDGDVPRLGPDAIRNVGWQLARGDVIAFTDDDAVPDPDWVRQGLLALEASGAEAASGRIVGSLPYAPTGREHDAAPLDGAAFVAANCFCRRRALEAVGGLGSRSRAARRETSDLFYRLAQAGFAVASASQAVVTHSVRPALWGVSFRAEATLPLVARRLSGTTWSSRHIGDVVVTALLAPALSLFHRVRGGLPSRARFW